MYVFNKSIILKSFIFDIKFRFNNKYIKIQKNLKIES